MIKSICFHLHLVLCDNVCSLTGIIKISSTVCISICQGKFKDSLCTVQPPKIKQHSFERKVFVVERCCSREVQPIFNVELVSSKYIIMVINNVLQLATLPPLKSVFIYMLFYLKSFTFHIVPFKFVLTNFLFI